MNKDHFEQLLDKYLTETATREETNELFVLLQNDSYQKVVHDQIGGYLENWEADKINLANNNELAVRLKRELQQRISYDEIQNNSLPVHRIHFLKTTWFRYAAAIIILFGIGAYLWNLQRKENPRITQTKPVPVKNDALPGADRAVLTLSNGQQVELNNRASETIKDGALSIENKNGKLIYKNNGIAAMNTTTTARGGQYQLTLADGTKVWLNAASSITYPTAFTKATREVAITGEVYFEIAKDKSKPFHVKTAKEMITVLGTKFNVNAYVDEPAMKTSLLEGSVKVGTAILRPGEAYLNGRLITTDLEQDMAWKNGAFNFRDIDIQAAFRQIGRWYSVDIKYANGIPGKKIRGEMGRDLNLAQVLKLLKDIGINTKLEGKTLIVLPD